MFGDNLGDSRAFHHHSGLFPQALPQQQRNARLTDHFVEHGLGHLRFVAPGKGLQMPVQIIVAARTEVEFEREAANHFAAADIGGRKSAADHAADVHAGLQQGHFQALTGAGNGGHDARGGAAIHHEIVGGLREKRPSEAQNECEKALFHV